MKGREAGPAFRKEAQRACAREKCFGSLLSALFLFAKMVLPERKLPRVGRRNTGAVFDPFQRFRKEFLYICVSFWLRLLNFRRISET
jgi:hypothetical protein